MKKVKITVLKTTFYYGDWIDKPGVAICSCNDGLRPVIFKLEATDQKTARGRRGKAAVAG